MNVAYLTGSCLDRQRNILVIQVKGCGCRSNYSRRLKNEEFLAAEEVQASKNISDRYPSDQGEEESQQERRENFNHRYNQLLIVKIYYLYFTLPNLSRVHR
jgi:hypothetical protein